MIDDMKLLGWIFAAAAIWAQSIVPGHAKVEAIVEKTGLMSGKKHVLAWEKFDGKFSVSPASVANRPLASSRRMRLAVSKKWGTFAAERTKAVG